MGPGKCDNCGHLVANLYNYKGPSLISRVCWTCASRLAGSGKNAKTGRQRFFPALQSPKKRVETGRHGKENSK
jgi:hypothetical protein